MHSVLIIRWRFNNCETFHRRYRQQSQRQLPWNSRQGDNVMSCCLRPSSIKCLLRQSGGFCYLNAFYSYICLLSWYDPVRTYANADVVEKMRDITHGETALSLPLHAVRLCRILSPVWIFLTIDNYNRFIDVHHCWRPFCSRITIVLHGQYIFAGYVFWCLPSSSYR